MAGCFGNSIFDRCMEQQLDRYLAELDDEDLVCEECGYKAPLEKWDTLPLDKDRVYCPECETSCMLNYITL